MQGLTVASWGTYLLQALAADRTLIVPDNPGMGFSEDTGNASASAEAAVQAYAELIKGLELHRPDILGWSYGGGIGLMLVRSLLQPGNRSPLICTRMHVLLLAGKDMHTSSTC